MVYRYSKKGCLTCKKRKKRCPEERPSCQHCVRLQLRCIYNELPTTTNTRIEQEQTRQRMVLSYKFQEVLTLRPEARLIGDFHRLPVREDQTMDVLTGVPRLANLVMDHMWPFRPAEVPLGQLRMGWIGPTLEHKGISIGSTALSAGLQVASNISDREKQTYHKYTSESIAEIRTAIDRCDRISSSMSEYGAMLASLQLPWLHEIRECNGNVIRQLANGAHLLVNRMGGVRRFLDLGKHQILSILIKGEWIASLANIDEPHYLNEYPRPELSDCLTIQNFHTALYEKLQYCCSPDVICLAVDLKLLLYYRHSPGQENPCQSLEEFWQLTSLLNYVDLQQCHIQKRYANTSTPSECLVYAMIVVRIFVVGDKTTHHNLGTTIYIRLYDTLQAIDEALWSENNGIEAYIWVLVIMLCTSPREEDHVHLMTRLEIALNGYFRGPIREWSSDWQQRVHEVLKSILWHHRLKSQLERVVDDLCC